MALVHGQRQPLVLEPRVEARDLAGEPRARPDLAGRVRRVVAPVAVGARRAQRAAREERARRELERARVAESRRGRVAEELVDTALAVDDGDLVPLVGVDPDVAVAVEGDAVRAVERGVL